MSAREGSDASEPSVRVRPNGLFRASTAGLVILGLVVLVWAVAQGELLLVVPAVLLLLLAVLRLRAGVVVSTTSVRVTEVRTRRVDLDDVALVEAVREGAGWTTQILRHDGPPCRVATLSSFGEEGAREAAAGLSLAIDEMRRVTDAASDEAV